jgi:Uma2 family endonuclease
MPITSLNQLDLDRHYTYADYLKWQLKERVELLKGRVFKMSPVPNVQHQRMVGILFNRLFNHLEGGPCQVFSAPFDVRLPLPEHHQRADRIDTVVQPDVCVICDRSKLDEQGCIGPPDLAIEVLSPGNTNREMKEKFELYEAAQVPEYWIVDPERAHLLQYRLDGQGRYVSQAPLVRSDTISSYTLQGFRCSLDAVFGEEG